MALVGGCACDNVRYEAGGDNQGNVLCHCTDCRKIGGFTSSFNAIYPEDKFKVTKGTPKRWTKKADGGNEITSSFCGDCGSTMWREGPTFPGLKLIKAGTLDDANIVNHGKVGSELYADNRPKWMNSVEGAEQKKGMQ